MRRFRFSIAGLMGMVLIAAVGLAGLRNATSLWAGIMLLLTGATLALAVVGAIYCRGPRQAWWLGFAIFGWAYLGLLTFCDDLTEALHPLSVLQSIFGILPTPMRGAICIMGSAGLGGSFGGPANPPMAVDLPFAIVAHCLWTLAIATVGGLLARIVFASGRAVREDEPPESLPSPIPWTRSIAIGLAAAIGVFGIAAIRSKTYAPELAGITFLLTLLFVGLAVLGATVGRGRRAAWTGAALFGAVYLAIVFTRPADSAPRAYLATDAILEALRPRLSAATGRSRATFLRLRDELERPVPMPFRDGASLDDVLTYIQQTITAEGRSPLPIYLDPIGLQDAGRSPSSIVRIDMEGVPLRETLRLVLKQLGLIYQVRDGYLQITWEGEPPSSVPEGTFEVLSQPPASTDEDAEMKIMSLDDPFVIVSHCLAALLAAGLGAVAGPIVAGRRNGSTAA